MKVRFFTGPAGRDQTGEALKTMRLSPNTKIWAFVSSALWPQVERVLYRLEKAEGTPMRQPLNQLTEHGNGVCDIIVARDPMNV